MKSKNGKRTFPPGVKRFAKIIPDVIIDFGKILICLPATADRMMNKAT
jgi:hypothetical protein